MARRYAAQRIARRAAAILLAASVAACSDAPEDAKPPFSAQPREAVIAGYEAFAIAQWEPLSVLYARVDPDLVAMVPGRRWTDEDHAVMGCTYDLLQEAGLLHAIDFNMVHARKVVKAVQADARITVLTIMDGTARLPEMRHGGEMVLAMHNCGATDLRDRRMRESGLADALLRLQTEWADRLPGMPR